MTWEPERGYRSLQTGEWVFSPAEAVGPYVDEAPEQRGEWRELAGLVQTFWLAQLGGGPGELEEVRFEG